jgi:hypothetical protein
MTSIKELSAIVQLPEKTKEMLVGFDHKTQKSK